jgi:hypothetical protein
MKVAVSVGRWEIDAKIAFAAPVNRFKGLIVLP